VSAPVLPASALAGYSCAVPVLVHPINPMIIIRAAIFLIVLQNPIDAGREA